MLPIIRKLGQVFSGSAKQDVAPEPVQQERTQQDPKAAFEARVKELWEKIDYCEQRLRELGMVPLEDSFIDELMIGLLPNPMEPFVGNVGGRFLKLNDDPPRKIAFLGAIAGGKSAYFTGAFFSDDGKMMDVIGYVSIDEMYDYLKNNVDADIARDFAGDQPGLLGRESKYLGDDDKITPPSSGDQPKPKF